MNIQDIKVGHLINVLQSGYVTIGVQFKKDRCDYAGQDYTYKCPESLAPAVGDEFIVEAPSNGYTVVKCIRVDPVPMLDLSSNFTYKWVVQKIDAAAYLNHREKEKALYNALTKARIQAARDQAMNEIRQTLEGSSTAMELFDKAMADFNKAQ